MSVCLMQLSRHTRPLGEQQQAHSSFTGMAKKALQEIDLLYEI